MRAQFTGLLETARVRAPHRRELVLRHALHRFQQGDVEEAREMAEQLASTAERAPLRTMAEKMLREIGAQP